MVVFCVEKIENKIRNLSVKKSIRVNEFFQDFDKNKTGYITRTQFFRVLYKNFGLVLSVAEEDAMVQKYMGSEKNMIDFKYFCCIIHRNFNPVNFQDQSTHLPSQNPNMYWNDCMEEKLQIILMKIHNFYTVRGLSLKSLCSDFDKEHNGNITQSQFYRSFQTPPNFTAEDMIVLTQKYHLPEDEHLISYFNLSEDLKKFDKAKEEGIKMGVLCCQPNKIDGDLQSLLDRLSVMAHTYQFRTMDFFKSFDNHNNGFIHISHFCSCLDLCFKKVMNLSESETCKLFRAFERPEDGMVAYRDFCNIIDDAFVESNLEQKPTKEVFVPPVGYFGRKVTRLSDDEEEKVNLVLHRLRNELTFYQRPLHYYFKDFDHHLNSGQVTNNQFRRVLSLCGLYVQPRNFELLCKKFSHSHSGFINYIGFLEQVDLAVISQKEKVERNKSLKVEKTLSPNKLLQSVDIDGNELDGNCLLDKLRTHIILNRIRIKDFFKDFDPLKTGKVSRCQFKRALSLIGTGSIKSKLNYNDYQLDLIADRYSCEAECLPKVTDNNVTNSRVVWNHKGDVTVNSCNSNNTNANTLSRNDDIMWNKLAFELERGYYVEELDKSPTLILKDAIEFICPKEGTKELSRMAGKEKVWFDELMNRMAAKIFLSSIDMLLIFRNFDKLRHGHLSRLKFRQALGIAGLVLPDELSLTALESAFFDVEGINYNRFLEEISKKKPLNDYEEISKSVLQINSQKKLENFKAFDCCKWKESLGDFESIFFKIKVKLADQSIRVMDWFKDYDKLRTGYISRSNFRRAIDQCRFGIDENEISLVEDHFKCREDQSKINYVLFCEELESIFTDPEIGKTLQRDIDSLKMPSSLSGNTSTSDHGLDCCLEKIKTKYKELRPSLLSFLRDFDKVNVGAVSGNQFRRVLEEIGLASDICLEAEWILLYKRFSKEVGGRVDVDYLKFMHWINDGTGC